MAETHRLHVGWEVTTAMCNLEPEALYKTLKYFHLWEKNAHINNKIKFVET
jgi:hypothetical protein